MKKLAERLRNRFRSTYIDERTQAFIQHNNAVFPAIHDGTPGAEILLELTSAQTSLVVYSYVGNVLLKLHNAKLRAYALGENARVSRVQQAVCHSFNAEAFSYGLSVCQTGELKRLFGDVYKSLASKDDVFNLALDGIWIGDLLYDTHLMKYRVPTVELNDDRFKVSLRRALYQYIYWRDYFDEHSVAAVNVTHCCYLEAIPLRVAVHRGIPAYQCNEHNCYYLTENRLWAYTEYYDYPELFKQLPQEERTTGLEIARERIQRRFAGEVGVDVPLPSKADPHRTPGATVTRKSAFTGAKKERVLLESCNIKILVAAHCFFDAPNGYGRSLFPDFYEWLTCLGEVSKKTSYDWYIKTHPEFLPGNSEMIETVIKPFPRIRMIPSDTSHHQLVEEGIEFALTVYGTIGFEYAALGKTVVNASLSNPHIRYGFNIHPKTREEYVERLMNLDNERIQADKQEIYEYYYMKYVRDDTKNWLFSNYASFLEEIGGYQNQFTPRAYERFLCRWTPGEHDRIVALLKSYISSGDYSLPIAPSAKVRESGLGVRIRSA